MFIRCLLVALLLAAPVVDAQSDSGKIRGSIVDVFCQSVTLWSDGTIEIESCDDGRSHLTFVVGTPPAGVDADGDGENDVEAGFSVGATAGETEPCERSTAPDCEDPCEGDDGASVLDLRYRGRRLNMDLVNADIHNVNDDGECIGVSTAAGGYTEGPIIVDDDDD
ncbi:MAG: hypothetical protein ACPGQL_07615 [Thermoplasmatota archaeon]